jgi:flagellar basal-body rod protein FlgC
MLGASSLDNQSEAAVSVKGIVESQAAPQLRYDPGNPLANAQGNIYAPNVNVIEEMTDMISASRAYQDNVEVMNTSKDLMLATLKLGQS